MNGEARISRQLGAKFNEEKQKSDQPVNVAITAMSDMSARLESEAVTISAELENSLGAPQSHAAAPGQPALAEQRADIATSQPAAPPPQRTNAAASPPALAEQRADIATSQPVAPSPQRANAEAAPPAAPPQRAENADTAPRPPPLPQRPAALAAGARGRPEAALQVKITELESTVADLTAHLEASAARPQTLTATAGKIHSGIKKLNNVIASVTTKAFDTSQIGALEKQLHELDKEIESNPNSIPTREQIAKRALLDQAITSSIERLIALMQRMCQIMKTADDNANRLLS